MFPKSRKLLNLKNLAYLLGIAKHEIKSDGFMEKCSELEQNLKLTTDRMSCILNIITKSKSPKLYEIHTTDKGVPVLVSIDPKEGKVKVFNINNNPEGRYLLRLDAQYHDNSAEILHLGGGIGLGHGRIAVERFVHHCIKNGFEKVLVKYSPPDKIHETRFTSFFTKCGFQLIAGERNEMVMQNIQYGNLLGKLN